jgi:hypothetical protein
MQSPMEQMASRLGLSLQDLINEAPPPPEAEEKHKEVKNSAEMQRIIALPRRPVPGPESADTLRLAEFLTNRLARHPNPYPGPLRPIQAALLQEAWQYGGALGPIRPGYGKTLAAYLLPAVVGAQRPLYVAPAALEEDVKREFKRFAEHWRGPHPQHYPFLSYQTLSAKGAGVKRDSAGNLIRAELLERIKPDLIVFDECHFVKNLSASVTKRVKRYLQANPSVRVVAMSGTMMRKSLKDFAHIARWALPRTCPLPTTYSDLETWADALDEKDALGPRADVGALLLLCNGSELAEISKLCGAWDEAESVRHILRGALRRRLAETPGVVATQDGPLGIPLEIHEIGPVREDPKVDELFTNVRALWELPNGRPIVDGLEMARHGKSMGLGYWGHWDPPPPDEWLDARREWASFARDVVRYNKRGYDSEGMVKDAVRDGHVKDYGALAAWEKIEPTYDPEAHAVAEWFSDEAIETARSWVAKHPGIIWVDSIDLGVRLSKELGLPYYGEMGLDARGKFILDHPKHTPMIASKFANSTGRNLQHGWSEGLWFCPPEEQALARSHRDGQEAETVRNWVYIGCWEHCSSYWRLTRLAHAAQQTGGQAMRLVYAQVTVPALSEIEGRSAPRWCK